MSQARAYVSQCKESNFAGTGGPGMHAFSFSMSGAIVREWAAPEGVLVVLSQAPSQGSGALNEVSGPSLNLPHVASLAMSTEESPQDPVGNSQLHTSHALGTTRSACPSYAVVIGPSGHSGACSSGPNQSNVGDAHSAR